MSATPSPRRWLFLGVLVDMLTEPIGIKGIAEIGVVGVSAAIANAVYHATGRRIRSLPITVEQLF
jgi:xanthine dehydrogenase YagR molybdenum-binding subunit